MNVGATSNASEAVVKEVNEDSCYATSGVHYVYATSLSSDFGEPETYKQAMNGPEKEKWSVAIRSEIMNFKDRNAWTTRNRADVIAAGRNIVGTKIVFKVKTEHDGSTRHKSRIVTKGYKFIPGIDYTESFAPVATDTAVRASMIVGLYNQGKKWTTELVDISAAFLEGYMDADKPVFIEIPDGVVDLGFHVC